MVLKGSTADPNVLALSEVAVLHIQNLAVPKLVRSVNEPDLARVVVKFEKLDDLDLEVEVLVLTIVSPGASGVDVLKF